MSQDIRKNIANNVKQYRLKNKLSKEKLSLILGFDNSYISKLEGERINITIDRLSKIADYLEVTVIDLLQD